MPGRKFMRNERMTMVHPLYWASDLTYAAMMLILLLHNQHFGRIKSEEENAFRILESWVLFFCIQDAFWGIAGGNFIQNDAVFFAASTIFHLSTVATTFFWLNYILTFLSDRIRYPGRFLALDGVVILFQCGLVAANFFRPVIFTIQNGIYITEVLRPLAFFNQYVVYLLISILTFVQMFVVKNKQKREKYVSVFCFSLAPVLSGIFQLLYPDGPFYSMGYFLGCFIIHVFVITRDREEFRQLQVAYENEIEIANQTKAANTDELTGLGNRRAYDRAMEELKEQALDASFVYVLADVNRLKEVNDTRGHLAGDELICGAAECLRRCFATYGTVYRIGGDEFAVLLSASREMLPSIRNSFEERLTSWRGEQVDTLSVSYGYASKQELADKNAKELAHIAEERMYQAKAEYYRTKGIDRRGMAAAHTALISLYIKILKINLTSDSYTLVNYDVSEQTDEMGISDKISVWLVNFGKTGQVHPDDLDRYLEKADIQFLRDYFKSGKKSISIHYRRKCRSVFQPVVMEMIPADDYTPENQSLFLYVRAEG